MKKGIILASRTVLLGFFLFTFFACSESTKHFEHLYIHRYEKAFMGIDTNHISDELQRLSIDYPIFLEGANFHDETLIDQTRAFVTDERAIEILSDINKKYPNYRQLEKELGDGLNRYRQFFYQDNNIPKVYTYLSYLDYENRVLFEEDVLLIAIDMYLGKDYPHYPSAGIPMYISARLDSQFIAADAMRAVAHYELGNQRMQSMLDHMILQGKVIYFLEKVLSKTDLSILFGYTDEQLKWCQKHEKMLWTYFAEESLIFEEDYFRIRNFVSESPTVQVFPGSPGRVTWFTGYCIVKKYMDKTDMTIPELFAHKDNQDILRESGYRP